VWVDETANGLAVGEGGKAEEDCVVDGGFLNGIDLDLLLV
jgi:hypothetical protein